MSVNMASDLQKHNRVILGSGGVLLEAHRAPAPEARAAGTIPAGKPGRKPKVIQAEERFEATPRKKGPRVGFPDLGPIPKRKFDPAEVCRSQARAQLVNLT